MTWSTLTYLLVEYVVLVLHTTLSSPLRSSSVLQQLMMSCYGVTVPTGHIGDSMDRVLIRCVEILASVLLVVSSVHTLTSLTTTSSTGHTTSYCGCGM